MIEMLHVLERSYKQKPADAEKEFPNCRLLMGLENMNSDYGTLLAVCDSVNSIPEFYEYIRNCTQNINILIFGFFNEEVDDCAILTRIVLVSNFITIVQLAECFMM